LSDRFDEAVEVMNRGRELDPLSLFMNARVGMALYAARRYDEANAILETTLEVDPSFAQARYFLSLVYPMEGRYEKAIKMIPEESFRAWVAVLHALSGDTDRARASRSSPTVCSTATRTGYTAGRSTSMTTRRPCSPAAPSTATAPATAGLSTPRATTTSS
jgi:predicted negative regulator of RcsB-dependent stress response